MNCELDIKLTNEQRFGFFVEGEDFYVDGKKVDMICSGCSSEKNVTVLQSNEGYMVVCSSCKARLTRWK